MMNAPLIELKNIERSYRNGTSVTPILKSVSLQIEAGEMVAIVGASGSGKSTLMNILGALDNPDGGEYLFRGRNIASLSSDELSDLRCHHFGFVFQRYHLLPHLTAVENAEMPAMYANMPPQKRTDRAVELLSRLGLAQQLNRKPNQLSGGQQQRVSIARALMNGGEIILADEPTGALDSKSSREVLQTLRELNQQGHTVILITHDMSIADNADRVITLIDGNIVSDERKQVTNVASQPMAKSAPILLSGWWQSIKRYSLALVMAMNMMKAHKMRAFLTMLGIIIGIASVITVVALGEGTKAKVLSEFNALGSNTIDIYPGKSFGDMETANIHTLNANDVALLKQQYYALRVSPMLSDNAAVRYQNKQVTAAINGVDAEFFSLKNYRAISGRLFNAQDVQANHAVGVIDKKSQTTLFGQESAVGKTLFLNDVPLEIIGVVETSALQEGMSANVWLPYTAMNSRLKNQAYFQQVTVQLKNGIDANQAEQAIIDTLTARHNVKDFFTFSSSKFLKSINRTTQALTLMISSIAFISLLVGGIGVMNIMLVSVVERTKEIGIRTSVGAKRKDILQQFLIEATAISITGGIIGVVLSLLIGGLVAIFGGGFKLEFTLSSFVIAFACSTMVGVVFGYFPAKNATKLKPIEALSKE